MSGNINITAVQPAAVDVVTIQLPGAPGPRGLQGIPGPSAILTIGSVTTGAAGSNASATISGVSPNQTLNLTIPRGNTGVAGPANTLTIGTVNTVDALTGGSATLTGTAPNQVLNLVLPRGYGVIPGGTTGQVLAKNSNNDYDTAWETPSSAPTAGNLVLRDVNGRAQVVDPAANADIATKNYVDNTAGTSSGTASALMRRDSTNGVSVGSVYIGNTPTGTNHATRKDYVDSGDATTLASAKSYTDAATKTSAQISDATSAATASKVIVRDANGRAQVVDPSVAADIATKNYVDTGAANARRYIYTNSFPNLASYTIALADEGKMVSNGGGLSSQTSVVTIPTDATMVGGVPPTGFTVDVVNQAGASVTITAAAGVTLAANSVNISGGSLTVPKGGVVRLVKIQSNYYYALTLSQFDTGWIDLSGSSLWQTANWSSSTASGYANGYRVKNGILYYRVSAVYNGATTQIAQTTAGAEGNIGDLKMLAAGAIPTAYVPLTPVSFVIGRPGITSGPAARINTDGSVDFVALIPGMTMPTGVQMVGTISWPID